MSHVNLYNNIISILKARYIAIDVNILEIACKLYYEGKSKNENYEYLKRVLPNKSKTQAVLHIIECLKDSEHPVIPTYADYVDAARQAKI